MIERAGPFHAAALAAIHSASFPPGEAWDAALMAGHLSMPGVFGLLDAEGGMILARIAADEAEVLTLGVAPARRRHGLGRALLLAASDEAAARGAARLFLEVSAANVAARALYAAAGFAPVGRRKHYYPDGSDALILARDLAARPGAAATCGAAAGS